MFVEFSARIAGALDFSAGFPNLTQYLLKVEAATSHLDTQMKRSVMNETFANMSIDDPLVSSWNDFAAEARLYYDNSFAGINTQATFVDYLSKQLATLDPVITYMSIFTAVCVGWPNLISYNVERYTCPFLTTLKNKILVVGVTNSAFNLYASSLQTF